MNLEYNVRKLLTIQETNFQIIDLKVFPDKIIWVLDHKEEARYICPMCKKVCNTAHDKYWITLRDVPVGTQEVYWEVNRARIRCSCSWGPIVEEMPFKSKNHFITKRMEAYIEEILSAQMITVIDVARIFGIDYGLVYKIDHAMLLRRIQHHEIEDPINICVDEKSFKKGHSYVTIVTDADRAKVIWVSEGNRKESLDEFFKILGEERCKKIKTVSKDLHKPYKLSCQQYIPHAIEVADKFHVIQRLNKTIDEARKEVTITARAKVKEKFKINSMNWIMRYKMENLSENQLESLEQLQKLNEPLYRAYLLKEKFFELFEFIPKMIKQAESFLLNWLIELESIGLGALNRFIDYALENNEVILNIIRERRSSALSEGINRKVSVIKTMAYGYRNIQYFMLKIMQRCGVLGNLNH